MYLLNILFYLVYNILYIIYIYVYICTVYVYVYAYVYVYVYVYAYAYAYVYVYVYVYTFRDIATMGDVILITISVIPCGQVVCSSIINYLTI